MFQQRLGQFLERDQPLQLPLIHPLLQVIEHGAFVAMVPQSFQALLEQIGLEDSAVQLEQPVQFAAWRVGHILPSTQQQPFLTLDHLALLIALAEEFGPPHFVDRAGSGSGLRRRAWVCGSVPFEHRGMGAAMADRV